MFLTAVCVGYLLGSIPFGYIAGRLGGVDVRERGSGNIGATNVLRVLGKRYGYAVFVADALKGYLAVRLTTFFASPGNGEVFIFGIVSGFAAVVGHSFPFWLKFRGGKGVATAGGACFALVPLPTLVAVMVWGVAFFSFRFVSLASLAAAAALPASLWLLSLRDRSLNYLSLAFTTLLAVLVFIRHRDNIVRLLNGTEPRFGRK